MQTLNAGSICAAADHRMSDLAGIGPWSAASASPAHAEAKRCSEQPMPHTEHSREQEKEREEGEEKGSERASLDRGEPATRRLAACCGTRATSAQRERERERERERDHSSESPVTPRTPLPSPYPLSLSARCRPCSDLVTRIL